MSIAIRRTQHGIWEYEAEVNNNGVITTIKYNFLPTEERVRMDYLSWING